MSCLNPHDPQMMRIFTTDGAFHTIAANNGGGMARDGVLVALPRTPETRSGSSTETVSSREPLTPSRE